MKKLLSILGAIGIVASSSTAVASCGGNPKANDSQDEDSIVAANLTDPTQQSAYYATSDLTKMMLISKTENIGNNIGDILTAGTGYNYKKYSPKMFDRFKNSNVYLSDNALKNREASHYAMWEDNFSSIYGDNGIESDDTDIDMSNLIDSSKLTTDYANISNDNLNYLLSNGSNDKINTNSDVSGDIYDYAADDLAGENNISSLTQQMSSIYSAVGDGSQLTDLFYNPTADKLPAFMTLMSNLLVFTGTASGIANETDGTQGHGNIRGLYYGQSVWGTKTLDGESKVGLMAEMFECAYNYIKLNQDKIDSEIVKYLVGSNDESTTVEKNGVTTKIYPLIKDVHSNNASSNECEAGNLTFDGTERTNKFWSATEDSGLFGEIISQMGSLLNHNKKNYKALKEHPEFESELAKNQGFQETNEPILIDPDFDRLQEKIIEAFNATSKFLDEDVSNNLFSELYKSVSPITMNAIKKFGIKIDEQNFQSVVNVILEIFKAMLDFEPENSNPKTLEEFIDNYSDKSYKFTTMGKLVDAIPLANADAAGEYDGHNPVNPDWFDDRNADYREAVYEAFGVKGNKIIENGFWDKFRAVTEKYKDTPLFTSDVVTADEWLYDIYDKNIIDPTLWTPSEFKFDYNEQNAISKISYTIEYDGIGNDSVANFKTTDEVKGMSEADIFNKLGNKDNTDFIKSYVGDGNINEYTNVKRKYTITWVNASQDPSTYDFKLMDLSGAQAFVDNSWKEFNY
jgi:hypothetical protein